MSVTTTQYIRKPLYVDAIRITGHNIDEVSAWCDGDVQWEESPGNKGTGKKYIRVRVHNPMNPRQTKAFVGDWILYTEKGYKIYTNKAFLAAFDEPPEEIVQDDPNITVIGPECFATIDGSVLSWKGTNYVPQEHQTISGDPPEDVIRGDEEIEESGITANEALEIARGEGLVGATGPEEPKKEFAPAEKAPDVEKAA